MTTPTPPPRIGPARPLQPGPPGQQMAVCPYCGAHGTLRPQTQRITRKRRFKFGLLWLLFTIITAGIGFVVWLIMPRYNELVSVQRYTVCQACGATL